MTKGANQIRRAAAEAIVRKLAEGASHDETSQAAIASADAEYQRLKREHEARMDRLLAGERPGPDIPAWKFWVVVAGSIAFAALLVASLIGIAG